MPSVTYPNGQTLVSSVRSPEQIQNIFQVLIAQMLGISTVSPPTTNDITNPAWAVRTGWQQQGQPAWLITDDVAVIMASTQNPPFSQMRDALPKPNDSVSLNQQMAFTQTWNIKVSVWGPNSTTRANLIVSGMTQDFFHDALAALSLYIVPKLNRPISIRENFEGQYWDRADINLKFNELVTEEIVVPTAASAEVTIITDLGNTETFEIVAP